MIVLIGMWHEPEAREFTDHSPTYYAADWDQHRVVPGNYPVYLKFEGGYTIPMPYWTLVTIDTIRIDGARYSGFGGVNFACSTPELGPSQYHIQGYRDMAKGCMEAGKMTLFPNRLWAMDPLEHVKKMNWGWDDIRKMAVQKVYEVTQTSQIWNKENPPQPQPICTITAQNDREAQERVRYMGNSELSGFGYGHYLRCGEPVAELISHRMA
jgi:hypothetical protein